MNPFLLGIGLAVSIAVAIIGLVILFGKKKILAGVCVVLAGIALMGGVLMIDAAIKSKSGTGTDQPVALTTPEQNTDGPTQPPEETSLPGTSAPVNEDTPAASNPTPTLAPTPNPTPTPTPAPTDTPAPTEVPGKYTEVHYDASTIVRPDNPNGSTIYLTFDDGPSAVTGEILDQLKKYNVKATFFVIGNEIDDNTARYVRRAIDEGHSVGIHTYTHKYELIYTSVDAYLDDFYKVDSLLKSKFNYRPLIFRFPGGASNERSKDYCIGIMTELTAKMPSLGYSYFDWNVSPEDAMEIIAPKVIADTVLKGIKADRKMNVVLMHDFDMMSNTAKALPQIIETALSQGYAFDRLTPETTPVRHRVFN
ncbi:MAG: polysaccharide deacetylase [Clostridia bacterium]|nr:polysaccharide deacetylase [Clostridia bacterium]